jgi:hypothetical protein
LRSLNPVEAAALVDALPPPHTGDTMTNTSAISAKTVVLLSISASKKYYRAIILTINCIEPMKNFP